MTRAVYRFRDHTIGPDHSPGAEPLTFTMQCTACDATGPASENGEDGTEWATQHFKVIPGHLTYREIITRPYRFEPGAWQ